MSYFSRLTDIVTCNLSAILAESDDPSATLEEIIEDMRAGIDSARRSVKTAAANEVRICQEVEELCNQSAYWRDRARQHVQDHREDEARLALMRRGEVEDLIAGIKQQHDSARSTLQHLTTTLHALEARLADALRRRTALSKGVDGLNDAPRGEPSIAVNPLESTDDDRDERIEAELAALKRELGA